MTLRRLLLIGLVVVLVVAVVGGSLGVRQLRGVLAQQLSAALGVPVTIGAVGWAPVFGVQLQDLVVPSPPGTGDRPWLRVAEVRVHVAPWSWFQHRTVVVDVHVSRPEVLVVRRADGRMNLPVMTPPPAVGPKGPRFVNAPPAAATAGGGVKSPAAGGGAAGGGGGGAPAVVPRTLQVRDGLLTYRDEAVAPGGVTVEVAQLQADLRLALPSAALRGRCSGVFRAPDGQAVGSVRGEGTFRPDRTGQGTVALTHQAIQQLAPYVQAAIGASPTAGTLTLRADVTAQGEQVTIPLHVEAEGLTFAPDAMTAVGVPAQQMVQLLQDASGRIAIDVTVQGRWDQLQVSRDSVIASVVQQALRSALARHLQQTILQQLPLIVAPPAEGEQAPASLEDRLKQLGRDLKRSLKHAGSPSDESRGPTP